MDQDHSIEAAKAAILAAALPHVPFDGWSAATLQAALVDSGQTAFMGPALFPRGGVDMAAAYHRAGDAAMGAALAAADMEGLKFREKVALAVRLRLQSVDREAVRKGAALFALPPYAAEGAALMWGTADTIWTALGDRSRDVNWYSKRASLSAVYGATVLFWLGDNSDNCAETWAFLDRRIENIMQFEKLKADFGKNPIGAALIAGPFKVLERITAPQEGRGLPGQMRR